MEHLADALVETGRVEVPARRREMLGRLVVPPLLARGLGEGDFRPAARCIVPELGGKIQRFSGRRLGPRPVAGEFLRLAELQEGLDARGAGEQRDKARQVVDRRRVRVARPRGIGGARQVRRFFVVVVAMPEVMGEDVDAAIDPVGIRRLEVCADPRVQAAPDGERQALIRDLLGRDVLEEVRLLELPIEPDEVGAAQRVEVVDDVGQLAEVRIRPGQGRRLEDPTDDRSRPSAVRRGDSDSSSIRDRTRVCRLSGSSRSRMAVASRTSIPRPAM